LKSPWAVSCPIMISGSPTRLQVFNGTLIVREPVPGDSKSFFFFLTLVFEAIKKSG
jgi:hypothetical protein